MRVAYADPPYIGQAKRHYGREEVDHNKLIERLETYDAWALSASSPSLHQIIPMCLSDVRIAAWVKPFASFKPGVNPAYAWEPVLFKGPGGGKDVDTVRDWVSCNITMRKGLSGAKPRGFCFWLFNLLGLELGDEFNDLFPGTGIVTECWSEFCARPRVPIMGRLI